LLAPNPTLKLDMLNVLQALSYLLYACFTVQISGTELSYTFLCITVMWICIEAAPSTCLHAWPLNFVSLEQMLLLSLWPLYHCTSILWLVYP